MIPGTNGKVWLWLVLLCLLAGCTLGKQKLREDSLPAGWQESSLEVGGSTRWYLIYTPESLPANPPMVIILHGGTGSMRSVLHPNAGGTKEWLVLAEKEGFVLLVPNGTNPETGILLAMNRIGTITDQIQLPGKPMPMMSVLFWLY